VDFNNTVFTINTDLYVSATITGVIQGTSTIQVELPPPEIDSMEPVLLTRAGLLIQSTAEPGVDYLVEQTEDFTNWMPVVTGTAAGIEFSYTETNTPLPDTRAYRLTYP
jgi:hypothetical protein